MVEKVFNLYLFMKSSSILPDLIRELGAVAHDCDGTDDAKIAFLQKHAEDDLKAAQRFPLPKRYTLVSATTAATQTGLAYSGYERLVQSGRYLEVFEEVFQAMNGPADPLIWITPVVDGVIQVAGIQKLS